MPSTATFTYTGAAQTWVVPTGITSITVECWGAQGGIGGASAAGYGGYAKATLPVTPGETLNIYVGGAGANSVGGAAGAGGFNGGGFGGSATGTGGAGGGGGTDVRQGGTALANRQVVAGGGGGGGSYLSATPGAGGGLSGGTSSNGTSAPGAGGTQTTGSALGVGGAGNYNSGAGTNGGGGGGGYWGGQGGSASNSSQSTGGGGGSGYVGTLANSTMSTGVQSGAGQVVLTYASAPAAPTLTAPVNASYSDLAANGGPFSWTFNSTDGTTQQSYALRRKISGAGAYEWWNVGTGAFQSTEVFNASTSSSVTFAAGKWTDGNVYNWSVNTTSTLNLTGVYAADSTVTANAPPTTTVTSPTGTQVTQAPTVSWSDTVSAPAVGQIAYRVVVESGAYGTVPGSGVSQYDSGVVTSTATSVTPTLLSVGGSLRAFVQITQTGGQVSGWGYSTFTISLDPPAIPTISGVWDSVNQRAVLTVQGQDNALSANAASLETDTTGWTAGTNTTLARSTAQAMDGVASLSLTATAGGAVSASTASGTSAVRIA